MSAVRLAQAFLPRANGLNLVRLCLATDVIAWHSFALTGRELGSAPLRQIMGNGAVDGFFAISGFLIVSSWFRRPDLRSYVAARFLRIVPGFWVCLILTVAVIAPLGSALGSSALPHGYGSGAASFLRANWLFQVGRYDVAGTPVGVPDPGVWNGSIWTLRWELLCYVGVPALGVLGLLHRTWMLLGSFALCWSGVALTASGDLHNYWIRTGSRFGLMFLAGALVFLLRDRLPVSGWLLLGAAVTIGMSTFLPDYRLVAALPLAYLLVAGSTYVRSPRLQLTNDISYGTYIYAFPIQQLLAGTWLVGVPVLVFMVTSTALTWVVAAGSWFAVERPANALRRRRIFASHRREPALGATCRVRLPQLGEPGGLARMRLRLGRLASSRTADSDAARTR